MTDVRHTEYGLRNLNLDEHYRSRLLQKSLQNNLFRDTRENGYPEVFIIV